MGINVCLYRKVGYLPTEDEIIIGEPDWDVKEVEWWDYIRQAGDRDFVNNIDWEHSHTFDDYLRPTNISDAMLWVSDNIEGKRRSDYLKALNEMITDPDLYFYISR